jgi:hypothetical protein
MFRPLEYFIIDALSRLSSQDESHVHSHTYTSHSFDTPVTIDRSVFVYICIPTDMYIHAFLIIFTNLWVGLKEEPETNNNESGL